MKFGYRRVVSVAKREYVVALLNGTTHCYWLLESINDDKEYERHIAV